MDARYSNVFIDAWSKVLESFSTKQIKSTDITLPKSHSNNYDIFASIGIIGDVDGHVYMTMDAETGKILTSEMLGGMEIADVDEMVISAVGEICNMVMGNACTSMSLLNASVDITPPTVLTRQEMPQLAINSAYNISVVLEDLDAIDFNVAVK